MKESNKGAEASTFLNVTSLKAITLSSTWLIPLLDHSGSHPAKTPQLHSLCFSFNRRQIASLGSHSWASRTDRCPTATWPGNRVDWEEMWTRTPRQCVLPLQLCAVAHCPAAAAHLGKVLHGVSFKFLPAIFVVHQSTSRLLSFPSKNRQSWSHL